MNKAQQFVYTLLRRAYARYVPEPVPSAMIEAADYGVADGVDYSRPVVVHGWERANTAYHGAIEHRLTEAARDYQSQFGDPNAQNAPIAPVTEDPLMEWDHATRERVLSNCHAAYHRNPLANSIVQFTTQFVVGDGFNLSCKNKQVEEILQAFIDNPDNCIREYERQAVNDLQVDGELFLHLFVGKGESAGMVSAIPRKPWECKHIQTELGNFRRVVNYYFLRHETEGDAPTGTQETKDETVPANQILYVAINRHAYELRGRPDLYRLLPWLRADTEWLSDRARQSKWRNALLWIVSVAGNPSAVSAILQQWRKPPAPGSAYVSSDRVTVEAATNSANAGDASNDGRAIRLMSVMGARLPEYFFGDGSMTNLATATKQELPALTKFETFQQIMVAQLWKPLFKRVIEEAINAGQLDEEVDEEDADGEVVSKEPVEQPVKEAEYKAEPETKGKVKRIKAVDAFDVTYEPVTQQDINTLTQALNTQKMNGWIDDITAMEKLGNDPHMVQKRLKKQLAQQADEMKQGLRPVAPGQEMGLGMEPEKPEPAKKVA